MACDEELLRAWGEERLKGIFEICRCATAPIDKFITINPRCSDCSGTGRVPRADYLRAEGELTSELRAQAGLPTESVNYLLSNLKEHCVDVVTENLVSVFQQGTCKFTPAEMDRMAAAMHLPTEYAFPGSTIGAVEQDPDDPTKVLVTMTINLPAAPHEIESSLFTREE